MILRKGKEKKGRTSEEFSGKHHRLPIGLDLSVVVPHTAPRVEGIRPTTYIKLSGDNDSFRFSRDSPLRMENVNLLGGAPWSGGHSAAVDLLFQ